MNYSKLEAKDWARQNMVGQWTTMMTPFTSNDEIDFDGLKKNIEHVLKLGTKGMGFSWNMGEFWSLTHEERLNLIERVPELVKQRAKIAFQITGTSLKEVISYGKKIEASGFDLAILAPPYLMTKTEGQVLDWVERVAEKVNIGIAFYNSPQFGITLSAKALLKMTEIKNLAAVKEASFNTQISLDTHLLAGKKAVISVPDEEIFFYEPFYGFHQQVMFANTSDWRFDTEDRHDYVEFINLATKGELEKAKTLYSKIAPVKQLSRKWWSRMAAQTGGSLPVQMVKYWGELMGMAGGHVRPPLIPLTETEKAEMKSDLEKLGITKVLSGASAS
ncbi:MAG: dihydrodipicolinate synthase family protein [Candidatus Eremiobacteraeota bacterium]|jgi:4-hydroxy-tetrahydrodipicolinate synthase|nr:dihydrodipicolinate synthase family protein [Candidatus Eremiobacteraeota bacterium]